MRAVLDASVGVPYVHDEVLSPGIQRWLARWTAADKGLVVPTHFWFEIVNVLARRHHFRASAILEAVHTLRDLTIETVELDEAAIILVIDATERYGLTAYDAQYLALSQQLDLPLVTLDRKLADAAGDRLIDPITAGPRLSEAPDRYGNDRRVTWPDYAEAASYLASLRAEVAAAGRAGQDPIKA